MNNIVKHEKKGYILMKSGIIFEFPEERFLQIVNGLNQNINIKSFIDPEGKPQFISEIKQFFNTKERKEYEQRQSGKFMCEFGNWHTRNQTCQCNYIFTSKKEYTSQHIVINKTTNTAIYMTKEQALSYKLKEDEYWYEKDPQSKVEGFTRGKWASEMREAFRKAKDEMKPLSYILGAKS